MRTSARRRRIPRCDTFGKEYGMGRREIDALSGWEFPVRRMRATRDGRVSSRDSDGSVDKPDTY